MTFLPIVGRELRVASRQRNTYWNRIGAGLGGIGIGGWIMLMPWFRGQQVVGPALFISLSVLTFAYALLMGVLKTADCLSEEKREGTLGLLFLTDLKGYDIVLGKLAATSLNAFYGLLAIFPVMAIPLLAGGVSANELTRVVVSSLATLFFSLSVGMFCSAICRDDRRAIVLSLVVVLFFAAGLPAIGGSVASSQVPRQEPNPLFFVLSPGYACFLAFDATYNIFPNFNFFWESIVTIHVLSWGLLIAACLIVPRTWQDKATSSERQRRRLRWQRAGLGGVEGIVSFRTRLLQVNPVYWLSSRDRLKTFALWLLLAVGVLLWIWGLAFYPRDWKRTENYFFTGFAYMVVLKFWMAFEAGRLLGADRKSGALELLLSTPITVREILQGHLMALGRMFGGPMLVVVAATIVFAAAEKDEGGWVRVCSVGILAFVADMIALAPLGLWMGMVSRSTGRAAAAAVVRVLVLPWMIFSVLIVFLEFRPSYGGSRLSEKGLLNLWAGISLAISAFFALWAWQKLTKDLRATAARQFSRSREKKKRAQAAPAPLPASAAP